MLKGTRLELLDAVKNKMGDVLKQFTEIAFLHTFDQWKRRLQCISANREYTVLKGTNINVVIHIKMNYGVFNNIPRIIHIIRSWIKR